MILRPSKHSHPDRTVVTAATVLLVRLQDKRVEQYDSLKQFLSKKIEGGGSLFLTALSFLYILGLVAYRPKTDGIEYLGPNESI